MRGRVQWLPGALGNHRRPLPPYSLGPSSRDLPGSSYRLALLQPGCWLGSNQEWYLASGPLKQLLRGETAGEGPWGGPLFVLPSHTTDPAPKQAFLYNLACELSG